MHICIPVNEDRGLDSPVCAHFGSAPLFLIVDTDDRSCRPIPNQNLGHAHGMCQPLKSLAGETIDGIAVGGIGMGALSKLMAAGIQVYISQLATVAETIAAHKAGKLQLASARTACAHHGQNEDCGSGQGRHGHGQHR